MTDSSALVPAAAERRAFPATVRIYAETVAMVGLITLAGEVVAPHWGNSAIDLLHLLPVLVAASFFGLRPALVAGALSALAYNYFFTEPVHTFRILDPADLIGVVMLLAVAVVTGQLAARMRMQARLAAAHAARQSTIAGFARRLLSCSTPAAIGEVSCGEIAALFGCNTVLVTAGDSDTVEIVAAKPSGNRLTPGDVATACWVLVCGEPAGRGAPRLSPAEWLFYPVVSKDRVLAAFGLACDDGTPAVAEAQVPLLTSLLDQAALALERAALEGAMRDVAQLKERDRLRHALLSSVGHDLRTPLTTIVAAAEELRRSQPEDGSGLTGLIDGEARRLERYVANLLDMARLEAGAIRLKTEPIDLIDSVHAALHDLRAALERHRVEVCVPADLPLVAVDPQLLHHCLINLLDNAARYSPPGLPVRISAEHGPDGVVLRIEDQGPGLPDDAERELFGRFEQIGGSDSKGGAGLGLAIVGGFAEAMGVAAAAANRPDGLGAVFSLHFPAGLLLGERDDEAAIEPHG
jgi:two-component system sensor histidine kinase KdpD